MSDVKAAEVKIFHSSLEKMEDRIVDFWESGKDVSWFDFLCEYCSTDVQLKWQEAGTPAADMY